ncbi:Holliday junction resolvase RecU [Fodinisporobacter ferrooxydans]|uniref:Holliday junction resolvase RecU n=1 Tax=Fodinisporobacter ferrooxydans TaxID=2901836 RepID=A0ABY4CRA1_9BACL|nr:Holliday junction resolvase RecU [Alicyclobacillaceae bacterium MYW30-H2]
MIRYPAGTKPKRVQSIPGQLASSRPYSSVGRGMTLEKDINETNQYYNETLRALVFKKPTPVNIVHVEYPQRSAAVIREAYFQKASTVDYSGVYQGKALEFEAKETRSKTNFPLDNFHAHQIEHLRKALYHGAIAFVIVRFTSLEKTYWLDACHVIEHYRKQAEGGRKSIPLSCFQKKGYEIPISYGASVDYLQVIDQLLFSSETIETIETVIENHRHI